MSFAGTPLGQGKRLDLDTFLGKNQPKQRDTYSSQPFGSSTLVTRSHEETAPPLPDPNPSQKARPAFITSRAIGPSTKSLPSQQRPSNWSVKDTSVNIAAAFSQAVSSDMQNNNGMVPNYTRASSVEYQQSLATSRRLPLPSRGPPRQPIGKTLSAQHVPDSEDEAQAAPQNGNKRGKTPMEFVSEAQKKVSFYARQAGNFLDASRTSDSYDYQAEEEAVRNAESVDHSGSTQPDTSQTSAIAKRNKGLVPRRSRIHEDNKAYKPSLSEEEEDDHNIDPEKKSRKKTKKKLGHGGQLDSLPVISAPKRRRRKSKKGQSGDDEEEEDGEDGESSGEDSVEEPPPPRVREPSMQPPSRHASVPRGTSAPPQPPPSADNSRLSTLGAIPEDQEAETSGMETSNETDVHRASKTTPSGFSLGSVAGKSVRAAFQIVLIISTFVGRVFGVIYDLFINKPFKMAGRHSGSISGLLVYLAVASLLYGAWSQFGGPISRLLPGHSGSPTYTPPEAPAANIDELNVRLQQIETVLSSLSREFDGSKARQEVETRNQAVIGGRLAALETYKSSADQGLHSLRHQVDVFHAQLDALAKHTKESTHSPSQSQASDEEARALVHALEGRVIGLEGDVKEAIELGKNAVKGDTSLSSNAGAAWWNKLASSGSKTGLTIKSSDGQDVTNLIKHLVDASVSMYSKDRIGRRDFALASAGARVIPSLTSLPLVVRPASIRSKLVSLVSGGSYAEGRPPVTALHHETHSGYCWPFAGSQGYLGVALSAPVHITDVTIDHVSKEIAANLESAPKEMELWGLVEGQDNMEKVARWKEERARRREELKTQAEAQGEVWMDDEETEEYPSMLPKDPQYLRIASFSYDIHGSSDVQTFPILQEVQELGIDFGIVVLYVKSNWGHSEFTCLYRLRIHGNQLAEVPIEGDDS